MGAGVCVCVGGAFEYMCVCMCGWGCVHRVMKGSSEGLWGLSETGYHSV